MLSTIWRGMKISAVIITFNEEKNIARCVASVQPVCDEIIIVDSFSTDRTCEISEQLGCRVIQHPFEGHIQQKNVAKEYAQFPWVLSLDADEALSNDLQQSIKALKTKGPIGFEGFTVNRLNQYCGQWIRHGYWYPDKKLRLWLRDHGEWTGTNPHDRFEMRPSAKIGHLIGDLLHYSIATKEEHLAIIHKYSSIGAAALKEKGKGHYWWKRFTSPVGSFIGGYLMRRGFLDGWAGFQISYLSAYAKYLKYKKLTQ